MRDAGGNAGTSYRDESIGRVWTTIRERAREANVVKTSIGQWRRPVDVWLPPSGTDAQTEALLERLGLAIPERTIRPRVAELRDELGAKTLTLGTLLAALTRALGTESIERGEAEADLGGADSLKAAWQLLHILLGAKPSQEAVTLLRALPHVPDDRGWLLAPAVVSATDDDTSAMLRRIGVEALWTTPTHWPQAPARSNWQMLWIRQ